MPSSGSLAKERVSRPRRARLNGEMSCEAAFRLIASGCLEDVAENHGATCAGDPAALHHMRVALTRLRSAISFFSPMVADSEWTRLKSELKWLNGNLGPTRDLDVAIGNCQGTAEERAFRTARSESQRRLRSALKSDRYRRWFNDLSNWVGNGPWSASQDARSARRRGSPTSEYHARRLARWHKKLVRRSRGLQGMGKHKRHRLRLASKRLRYAIEFSEGTLAKDDFSQWRTAMKHLRKGQQILGELNDAEVRRSLATSLEHGRESVSARDLRHSRLLDRKKEGRLLRRAAIVYRKIAG
jgi:CHAD domain-containing protein